MFEISSRAREIRDRMAQFLREAVLPAEEIYRAQQSASARRWISPQIMEELKRKARADGLWNLFLSDARHGAGLSHLDSAQLAEMLGQSMLAPEVFNANAPDAANMEVLLHYGNEFQKRQWLDPLLAGEMRSAWAVTEPDNASSDPNNVQCSIVRDGDHYRLSGRKSWVAGAMDARCRFFMVLGQSEPEAKIGARHSILIVPRDFPGVRCVGTRQIFGYDDEPGGYADLVFDDARVPLAGLLYGEGKGVEMAQGRIGASRLHQCMRWIGLGERALRSMVSRAQSRVVYGQPLARMGMAQEAIARSRCELDAARLLVLSAASALDRGGTRGARERLAMVKWVVPGSVCAVLDRAIQWHGSDGLDNQNFLAHAYATVRAQRISDGPDEMQLLILARMELERVAG